METMGWLIIFIVLIVIELLTMGLTTIWFAGGALAALLMSVLGFGMPVQVVVFIIVSVLLLVLTRPIAVKYFNQNRQKTNVESLIGQQALVLEDVDTLHIRTGKSERADLVGEDRRDVWFHCKRYGCDDPGNPGS